MEWLSDVYQVCALVGGTILVLQTMLLVFGGSGDHDLGGHGEGGLGGHDVGHVHEGLADLKWLSLKTIVSALTFFGLAGLASQKGGLAPLASLAVAVVSGGIAIFLVALLMASLSRLQSKGNLSLKNAVGLTGRVYLRIPGGRAAPGKVTLDVQGRSVEVEATTAGPEIPTGASVRVVGMADADTLDVTTLVG